MAEERIGTIDHYFARIGVAGIALTAPLRVGDRIHVRGHTTDFEQTVDSIQIEHESVQEAKRGASAGIMVSERCREGDEVYRVT
ncbi:MAG TPA: translation elongation factor-like protein [Dehalococcoidia bacterium]